MQLLDGALGCAGHSESSGDSAVLRLADGLTESVLLQTALAELIVARIHGRNRIILVGTSLVGKHRGYRGLASRVSPFGSGDLITLIGKLLFSEYRFQLDHPIVPLNHSG